MVQTPDDLHFPRKKLFQVTSINLFFVYNLYGNASLQAGGVCTHHFAEHALPQVTLEGVATALH